MSRLSRRRLLAVSGITVMSGLAAACGATATPTATPAPQVAAPTDTPAAAAATEPTATTAAAEPTATTAAAEPTATTAAAEPTAAAAEAINLRWWYGWGGSVDTTFKEVAKAFNEAHPGLVLEAIPGFESNDKLLTAIAGGDPPDIQAGNATYMQFFSRGAALPLSDMLDASTAVDKADYPPDLWRSMTWDGEIYGIPVLEAFARDALCYNPALLDAAGFSKPPETWDEAYEQHVKLTTFDSAGNVTMVGFDPMDAMGGSVGSADPFVWPPMWGFEFVDPDKKVFNLDNEDFVEILTTIKRFYDVVGAEKMTAFRKTYGGWTGPQASFTVGVQAMQINGYWTPASMATDKPDVEFGYTWVPMPTKRKGVKLQITGGHAGFIPQNAKHPAESSTGLEYLQGDEAFQMIYDGCGFIGGRISPLAKLDISKYPGLEFFVQSVKEATELKGHEVNPVAATTSDVWIATVDAVNFGTMTPEAAATDMQDKMTKAMKDLLG